MINGLSLVLYLRGGKHELMAHGNNPLDRHVFHYLIDLIDLRTGLIGTAHKVSYARIALDVSDKGGRGRRSVPASYKRNDVCNSIGRLCDYGLLDRLSEKGKGANLTLRACVEKYASDLAPHESEKNELGRNLPLTRTHQVVESKQESDDLKTDSLTQLTISSPSFLPTTSDSQLSKPLDPSVERPMDMDWSPSEKFIAMINQSFKPSDTMNKKIKAALIDYKMYWSAKQANFTQTQWETKFFRNELKPLLTGEGMVFRTPKPQTARGAANKPVELSDKLFGEMLAQFGARHGFRGFEPGEKDNQYRDKLRIHLARLNAGLAVDNVKSGASK